MSEKLIQCEECGTEHPVDECGSTPPPGKQPAAETLAEIADQLAKQITDNPCSHPSCCPRTAKVAADILSALRNERERCWQEVTAKADEWRRQAQQPNAKKNTLNQMAHGAAMAANVLREGK